MVPNFEDDDDKETAQSRFRQKVAELEDEDDDAGGTDDDGAPGDVISTEKDELGDDIPEVRLTRREKKQQRLALREHAAELERSNRELTERLARLEGAVQAGAMNRRDDVRDETDEDPDAELDRRLGELQEKQEAAWNKLRAKGNQATQADKDEYTKFAKSIDIQKTKIAAEGIVERRLRESQGETRQAAIQAQLQTQYQDVYAKPEAVQYAEGEYRKLRALGQPDGPELVEKAMNAARQAFRMSRQPPPSERDRQRFAGVPAGRAGGTASKEPETIKMTKELRKMANSLFSHIPDEKKRYQMWAQGPGREYIKSMKGE